LLYLDKCLLMQYGKEFPICESKFYEYRLHLQTNNFDVVVRIGPRLCFCDPCACRATSTPCRH
jgi:hypothetical protein